MVSARRSRAWADTLLGENISAGGTALKDLLAGAPTVDTLTAIRLLIHVHVSPDLSTVTDGVQVLDVGIGVSSGEAFALGVTALPEPQDASAYPPRGWIYVDRWVTRANNNASPIDQLLVAEIRADVRAMRRIDKGTMFMFLQSSSTAGSAYGVNVAGRVRVLCLT